ncbi:hypothetical protein SEA_JINKIES_62 [Arthrobacter phage Jinkies]|uniref:Uncharacterized protein n=1 Tax=Arthrobacter phage Jinkies TaxID=2743903 RepID=A0A7T0IFJ0_9CAUD|nr:hypothetical protein SEA_JINKIES_62 [Arthrobacter phage Jinkies]
MIEELWTAGDIAARLGISASLVSNWGYPGRRQVPEPFGVTRRGVRMWNTAQADRICAEYTEWRQARDAAREDRERADRALQLLTR